MAADNEWFHWQSADIGNSFSDCRDLGEVISKLEKQKWQEGKVICEVLVNDLKLTESDESKFSRTTLEELKTLSVRVKSPDELINGAQESLICWVPIVQDKAIAVAEQLRNGNYVMAMQNLKKVFEGCTWLSDALVLLRNLALGDRLIDPVFASNWNQQESQFNQLIRDLMGSLERKDYLELADLLEYEVSSNLDKWLEILGERVETHP